MSELVSANFGVHGPFKGLSFRERPASALFHRGPSGLAAAE
ncbi:hypothetical protein AK812_SmicGene46638, partial [Symbiodinium microadriaticum]